MYKYNDSYFIYNGSSEEELLIEYESKLRDIIQKDFSQIGNETPYYKVITHHSKSKWVEPYIKVAEYIRENFDNLVLISMGGAALNPQTLIGLTHNRNLSIRILFLDNTDPYNFDQLISDIDLTKTAFLVISNSGETLETLSLLGAILEEYRKSAITDYKNNFYFITKHNNSTLYKMAKSIGAEIFEHDTEISGRYSSFTNVSTLIGLIAGLNMNKFLDGANEVIDNFFDKKEHSLPARSAISLMVLNKPILVNLGYIQKLLPFLDWYSQIIAESLGKDTKGFTPLKGIGPNDQHSMLQLYLEGPKDKVVTMFYVNKMEDAFSLYKVQDNEMLGYLKSKSLEKINKACFYSTMSALRDMNVQTRSVILDDLSEKSVGALMAHCMIEVILLGHLLAINPFNQPSVEIIKKHAKQFVNENLVE